MAEGAQHDEVAETVMPAPAAPGSIPAGGYDDSGAGQVVDHEPAEAAVTCGFAESVVARRGHPPPSHKLVQRCTLFFVRRQCFFFMTKTSLDQPQPTSPHGHPRLLRRETDRYGLRIIPRGERTL